LHTHLPLPLHVCCFLFPPPLPLKDLLPRGLWIGMELDFRAVSNRWSPRLIPSSFLGPLLGTLLVLPRRAGRPDFFLSTRSEESAASVFQSSSGRDPHDFFRADLGPLPLSLPGCPGETYSSVMRGERGESLSLRPAFQRRSGFFAPPLGPGRVSRWQIGFFFCCIPQAVLRGSRFSFLLARSIPLLWSSYDQVPFHFLLPQRFATPTRLFR